jgi:hypothetical protein
MLTIKTKYGEVQIKVRINGGLATCKYRLIDPDGYEYRYDDFIFYPSGLHGDYSSLIFTYFKPKIWFTEKRGNLIQDYFSQEIGYVLP